MVTTSLLHIITSFIITYYYILCYYTVIALLLPSHYYVLLRYYYIIITSLLLHYYQWLKKVIMGSSLRIMHFPCFQNYIVITHYYYYYPLLHVPFTHYYMLPTGQLADEPQTDHWVLRPLERRAKLAPRRALCIFIPNKRNDDLCICKVHFLIHHFKQLPQTWHISSKITTRLICLIDVYSIQRHSEVKRTDDTPRTGFKL